MKLSICAIFQNESLYLREWIEFHRMMGVEKFYLYNNRSTDGWKCIVEPYIALGIVDVKDWPHSPPTQLAAYQDCIDRTHDTGQRIAFLDCDEFLWSPSYDTVTEPLSYLPETWGAVGVNWMCFGDSGLKSWENVPVIERFTWRIRTDHYVNSHIKSIVNMRHPVHVGGDPHFFHAKNGTFNENGRLIGGPFSKHVSDVFRINHYLTKSKGELIRKVARGRVDVATPDDIRRFDGYSVKEVQDLEIQKFLPELKRRLR